MTKITLTPEIDEVKLSYGRTYGIWRPNIQHYAIYLNTEGKEVKITSLYQNLDEAKLRKINSYPYELGTVFHELIPNSFLTWGLEENFEFEFDIGAAFGFSENHGVLLGELTEKKFSFDIEAFTSTERNCPLLEPLGEIPEIKVSVKLNNKIAKALKIFD